MDNEQTKALTNDWLEFHRLTMRGIRALISGAPGFHATMTTNSALLLSGEPVVDLNVLMIGPDPDAEQFLKAGTALAVERQLPLLVLITPDVGGDLTTSAQNASLIAGGKLPLMVLRTTEPLQLGSDCKIEAVTDPQSSALAGDIQASAFELPRASVSRALDASRTAGEAVTFIGFRNGKPLAALTAVRSHSSVGVWTMATLPGHQREGIGRALLTRVLEKYRQEGANCFYLSASEAGRPLYESIGFKTVGEYGIWILPNDPKASAMA